MTWIITIVYWAVFVAAIHPIYTAVLRASVREGSPMNLPGAAVIATLGAFFWPVAVPFLVSHYLHTGRTFTRRHDLNEMAEAVRNERLADASRTHAMMEIERTAIETIIDRDSIPKEARIVAANGNSPFRYESDEKLRERLVSAVAQGNFRRADELRAEMARRLA